MANFKQVNKAIKESYPELDIKVVRCNGYVYFDGESGFDRIESIYTHPTSTSTESLTKMCLSRIADAVECGEL